MTVQAQRPLVMHAHGADDEAAGKSGLVTRARGGDREAFGALVDIHVERVHRIAYRFGWDADDAEDIVQETFIRAFDHLRSLRSDADFAPWLCRIAVNECLAHRARQQRASAVPRTASPVHLCDDPQARAAAGAVSSRVRDEIRKLPKRQRAAIVLFELEDCSIEETALVMGCAGGTVKRHLHRARAALRERLTDLLHDAGDEGC
jgi:RNA polymerase sigma-70 factor (ECF subfamily)